MEYIFTKNVFPLVADINYGQNIIDLTLSARVPTLDVRIWRVRSIPHWNNYIFIVTITYRSLVNASPCIWKVADTPSHIQGYERVYLPLFKVADTPFHVLGDEIRIQMKQKELTKTFMLILNLKEPFVYGLYKHTSASTPFLSN